MTTSDITLPTSASIETGGIYGMAINETQVFTVIADYSALSDLKVYDLSSKTLTHTLKVAIGASKIYFNE